MARLLGLDLRPSGGAALEAFARDGDPLGLPLSVPMQRRPTCDFSYAGLKTAVRLAIEERCPDATGGWGAWQGWWGPHVAVPTRSRHNPHEAQFSHVWSAAVPAWSTHVPNAALACLPSPNLPTASRQALSAALLPFLRSHPCRVAAARSAEENRQLRADIAASFQRVAVQHLEDRCRRAVQWAQESHPEARELGAWAGQEHWRAARHPELAWSRFAAATSQHAW